VLLLIAATNTITATTKNLMTFFLHAVNGKRALTVPFSNCKGSYAVGVHRACTGNAPFLKDALSLSVPFYLLASIYLKRHTV